jgi:hypothetical protein
VHPVIDTQSADCHSGTELLCQRSQVGSKRRFCSAFLCVSAFGGPAFHKQCSSQSLPAGPQPVNLSDAGGSSSDSHIDLPTGENGTFEKLQLATANEVRTPLGNFV